MRNIRIAYWGKYDGNKYHCCCRSDNLRLAFQLLALSIVSSRTLALWCWHYGRCCAVIMSATFTPTLNVDIGTNASASARKHRDQLESKSVTLACAGTRRGLHTLGVRVNAKAARFTQFMLANVAEHLENPNKSNPCFKDTCFHFFSLCGTSWACFSSFWSYFDQICIGVSTKQIHL